jgi:hypothetical protein
MLTGMKEDEECHKTVMTEFIRTGGIMFSTQDAKGRELKVSRIKK